MFIDKYLPVFITFTVENGNTLLISWSGIITLWTVSFCSLLCETGYNSIVNWKCLAPSVHMRIVNKASRRFGGRDSELCNFSCPWWHLVRIPRDHWVMLLHTPCNLWPSFPTWTGCSAHVNDPWTMGTEVVQVFSDRQLSVCKQTVHCLVHCDIWSITYTRSMSLGIIKVLNVRLTIDVWY